MEKKHITFVSVDSQTYFPPKRRNELVPPKPQSTKIHSWKDLRYRSTSFRKAGIWHKDRFCQKKFIRWFSKSKSKPNFLKTTCWFQSVSVSLISCHTVKGCSVRNLLLFDHSNRNTFDRNKQKLFTRMINLGSHNHCSSKLPAITFPRKPPSTVSCLWNTFQQQYLRYWFSCNGTFMYRFSQKVNFFCFCFKVLRIFS